MTKYKPLVFRVKSDLYPHEILFWVGPKPTPEELGKACRRRGIWNGEGKAPDVGNGRGATLHFKHACVVWLDSGDIGNGPLFLSTFNHELVHALVHASDFLGCQLSYKTDEFHAYYAGFITKQAMKRIYGRLCK